MYKNHLCHPKNSLLSGILVVVCLFCAYSDSGNSPAGPDKCPVVASRQLISKL